jgi:hypothetical protein
VCHPSPPPLYALKDIFGRFGNLIDIFMLNGKNFGYAKYAAKSSADDARNVRIPHLSSSRGSEFEGTKCRR